MRRFGQFVLMLLIASTASAQVTAPTPPTAPVVESPILTPGGQDGSATSTAKPDIATQMQKILGGKDPSQALAKAMVIGTMFNCTQQQAGKEATKAFYGQMEQVGKTVETYCKQSNATAARSLMLSTFQAKHNDPVLRSALACYEQQRPTLITMAGNASFAADMEHYARWIRDPSLANKEMTEADVCRTKAVAQVQ